MWSTKKKEILAAKVIKKEKMIGMTNPPGWLLDMAGLL
jgi:ppGpp synthetase/RelA/SpoT-type nucleotidyltranferase